MDWEAGSHASTFGGNPVSCQAALATIELLEEGLMDNADVQGGYLMDGLRELQRSHECMGDVRGLGLMVGIEFVEDRENKEPDRTWRNEIIKIAFQKGLLLLGCGENSIRFCPALTVTTDEIDKCLTILDDVIKEMIG
jgi:4-aminobutyrate aminotransferase